MTDERQALFELIEKRADSDFVRELLAFAAERLMTVEVEALTGAAHGERTPERAPRASFISRTVEHRRYSGDAFRDTRPDSDMRE